MGKLNLLKIGEHCWRVRYVTEKNRDIMLNFLCVLRTFLVFLKVTSFGGVGSISGMATVLVMEDEVTMRENSAVCLLAIPLWLPSDTIGN